MRSLLTRGLTALVLVGSLAAVAPAAHAETVVVRDARGDVKRFAPNTDRDATISRAPRERSADITRLRVTHSFKRIGVGVSVRDLDPAATQVLDIQLRLPGGDRAFVSASTFDGRWSTFAAAGDAEGFRECQAWTTPRPALDRLVVTIPRRCLNRPDWVRTTVSLATIEGNERREIAFVDAVHQRIGFGESPLRYGPKVHVG
ncbi:hypothetical protein GCM10023340_11240 [Nocardioides marinquilinus]|uniref:Secreted protein n=1 Tax=Nocardioides marinquilinus TaxID=1210400 RepID=A0ABP9PDQ8_9ACTN